MTVIRAAGPIEASHHPGRRCLEANLAPSNPPAAFKLKAIDAEKSDML